MKDVLILGLSVLVIVYVVIKNREKLKELSTSQILGVGASYLLATILASLLIYYGGNWIAEQFSSLLFKYIAFIGVVLLSLCLCINLLNKVLQKITNGRLPNS